MQRRHLFLAGGAAVLWPVLAAAQPPPRNLPIIGYFSARSPDTEAPFRDPFLQSLRQSGLVDGRDVAVEYRFAEGRNDRLPAFAAEFVRRHVAVIVATEPRAAAAAKAATATIPIVFTSGQDPVRLGLVASLRHPGANATGIALFTTELGPKRLDLLRELLPQPGLIAFIIDPHTGTAPFQREELERAAHSLKQPILVLEVSSNTAAEQAFATMATRGVSGVIYGASTFFQVIADRLIAFAARYRLPAIYEWREFVTAGGLMSYSTSRSEVGRQLGDYAGRILKGANPSDLPVVQSARFELVINLKTAKALGLSVPQSLLQRADEVIE